MYFSEQIPPDADVGPYRTLLAQLSKLLLDCIQLPLRAHDVAMHVGYGDGRLHHSVVLTLTRHFCEQLDGVAVLATEGCAEPCKPLLRSALEASLGVQFILQTDSENRGLAYQVAHAHRKIKLYRKLDSNQQAGQDLRKRLIADPHAMEILSNLPAADFPAMIANLQKMLSRPPYDAIESEWSRVRGKRSDPQWYSLFGGPRTIRELAERIGKGFWYEFMYSHWSDVTHAGGTLSTLSAGDAPGRVVIRPLRHPEELQAVVNLGTGMCVEIAHKLHDRYGTETDKAAFRQQHASLRPRLDELGKRKLIDVPWR